MFSFKMGPVFEESNAKEKMCPACFGNPSDASVHCVGSRCAKWISIMNFCVAGVCPRYHQCHKKNIEQGTEECDLLILFADFVPEDISDSETGCAEIQERFGFCSL